MHANSSDPTSEQLVKKLSCLEKKLSCLDTEEPLVQGKIRGKVAIHKRAAVWCHEYQNYILNFKVTFKLNLQFGSYSIKVIPTTATTVSGNGV